MYRDYEPGPGRCMLRNEPVFKYEECQIKSSDELTLAQTAKLLSVYNKWQRGGKDKILPPKIIGYAIDVATHTIRQLLKERN